MNRLSIFHHHVLDFAKVRGLPIAKALAETRAMGFDGLVTELSLLARGDGIEQLLDDNGLSVHAIFAGIDFIHEDRSACARRTGELLEAANRCKADSVLILPGLFREGDDTGTGIDRIFEGLSEACRLAASIGIDVTIENFGLPGAPNGTIAGCQMVLDNVSELKFTFDTGNFSCFGEDPHVAYGRLRDRMAFVHLKDHPSGPNGPDPAVEAPIGDGALELEHLVRRMLEDGYTGGFVVEHFGHPDQGAAMRRSASFCHHILGGRP